MSQENNALKEEDVKKLNVYQKINLVMQQVSTVNKGTEVSITSTSSYKAVSHDDVTALLHKPITEARLVALPNLSEAGLETYQTEKVYNGQKSVSNGYIVKVWATVDFVNIDKPEDKVTTKCFSYALDSGDKATGKAYSMAVKYCYLKTFMLESQDEEESRDNENNWQGNKADKNNGNNNRQQNRGNNASHGNDRRPDNSSTTNSTNSNTANIASNNQNQTPPLASPAQKKALTRLYNLESGAKVDWDINNINTKEASDLIKAAPAPAKK